MANIQIADNKMLNSKLICTDISEYTIPIPSIMSNVFISFSFFCYHLYRQ